MRPQASEWTLRNPRTGEKIKEYRFSSEAEVFKSIEALHQGFAQWKKLSFKQRQEKLSRVVDILEKNHQQLAKSMTEEMGKSLDQSLAEVQKCIDSAKYLCTMDEDPLKSYLVPNKTYDQSEVTFEPLGVLLSILPWNYPAWQGVRAFFPNLLAGNTILLKHSEVTPSTGDLFQDYFKQAGLSDLLQHHIFSHDLTEKVIADPRVGGVSITGSVGAGKTISELCSRHFKKSVLELGGSDPAVVLENADLIKTCKSVAKSRLQNAGQVCISVKRLFIPATLKNEILNQLKQAYTDVLTAKIELVGPLAQTRFKQDYNKIVAELKKHSELIFEYDMNSQNKNDHTAFVNPCILYFNKTHELLKTTEVFGPCLIVIPYHSVDEAIELANSTVFGLGASVYGADLKQCQHVALQLQAGQVSINDFVRSDVCLPFGGYKMSGHGREVGHQGFFEFTQTKVISIRK